MYKKLLLSLLLLTLTITSLFQPISNAATYQSNSKTLRVHQGNTIGKLTPYGPITETFFGKDSNQYLTTLKKLSSTTKYKRAFNNSYKNLVAFDNMKYPTKINNYTINKFNTSGLTSKYKINSEFIRLINIDRRKKGLNKIAYGSYLQPGTERRNQDVNTYGYIEINNQAHVRLDGSKFGTAHNIVNNIYRIYENQGMYFYKGNPYELLSERYIAYRIFDQFKHSKEHYKIMMQPFIKTGAVNIDLMTRNNIDNHWSYFVFTASFDIKSTK